MTLLQKLQAEADDLAFRAATFDGEELPEKPLLRSLIVEARIIRRDKLRTLEQAIKREAGEGT